MPIAHLGPGRLFPVWDEVHQKANGRAQAWASKAAQGCRSMGEVLRGLEDAGAFRVHMRSDKSIDVLGRVWTCRLRFSPDGAGGFACSFAWVEMENPDCP